MGHNVYEAFLHMMCLNLKCVLQALVLPAFVFYKLHVELIESYGRAENLFEQHSHQVRNYMMTPLLVYGILTDI